MQPYVMKDQPPPSLTDINIHSDTQAEPRKIILTDPIYRLVAGGETRPWAKPPCDNVSSRGDIPKNRSPR
jgi:hypothetical protein